MQVELLQPDSQFSNGSKPGQSNERDFILLTGSNNPDLAIRVGKELQHTVWSGVRKPHSDGEIDAKLPVSVRRKNVYIIQSTGRPDVHRSIAELALMIRTARDSDANEITAIIPHFAYQRSDKKDESRIPIAAKLMAEILEIAGADRVVTWDLHNNATEGTTNKTKWINLYASWIFTKVVEEMGLDKIVVASPDAGGLKRARWFRNFLRAGGKMTVASDVPAADKFREPGTRDLVQSSLPEADYSGQDILIVDDQLSSGNTLRYPILDFKKFGAKSVNAFVTHAHWTGDAVGNIASLPLNNLYVTDSLPQDLKELQRLGMLRVVSLVPMIAGTIKCIEYGYSLSEMYVNNAFQERAIAPLYDPNQDFSLLPDKAQSLS